MSKIKDCGDMTVAVSITTGVKFSAAAVEDDEKLARAAINEKIAEILPQLEKTLLDQICDHIGYDAETVEAKVKLREGKNASDRKAEENGRAVKQKIRDGLPPLQPPPPAVHVEEASEQEDNTAE